MTAGADDYLTKPYRAEELLAAVDAVLQRRNAQKAAISATLQQRFLDALRRQREVLAEQFEGKLARELSARWQRESDDRGHREFDGAALLLANLFGALGVEGGAGNAELALQAFQAARDTLGLFGAVHVMPYGENVLAVFDADSDQWSQPALARALRGAQALGGAASRGG